MRFSPIRLLLLPLLCLVPAAAHAGEHWVGLDPAPAAAPCTTGAETNSPPAKPGLLADDQAGLLVDKGQALAPNRDSSAQRPATLAAPDPRCQTAKPEGEATFAAMASRLSGQGMARLVRPGMPLLASQMTSGFGMRVHPLLGDLRMHSGIDLAAPLGSPIFATDDGRVSEAGWEGGYGLFAAIDHAGGLQTRYGHMSRLIVMAGQQVQRGQVIGFVGSTGRSTGPHLHYEMRYLGRAINPLLSLTAPGPARSR